MKWMYSITLFKTLLGLWLTCNLLCLALLYIGGCSSNPAKDGAKAQSGKRNNPKTILLKKSQQEKAPTTMEITYTNKSSSMTVSFDLNSQDVYIDMTGNPESEKSAGTAPLPEESSASQKVAAKKSPEAPQPVDPDWGSALEPPIEEPDNPGPNTKENKKLKKVLAEIRKAQELFYQKKYQEAMDMTRQSLEEEETAEGNALMGTLLYVMDNKEGARSYWKKSLKLNPDMPNIVRMLEKIEGSNR